MPSQAARNPPRRRVVFSSTDVKLAVGDEGHRLAVRADGGVGDAAVHGDVLDVIAFILGGVAVFAVTPWGLETIQDPGSHGLSEIVYEFSSAAANNGSGFEGLDDSTVPWNVATGTIMLMARYLPIILPLAIAGSLGAKKATSEGAGTFRTDSWMFGIILAGTVLIVGALLFLPLAILGPISEYLAITT